MILRPRFWFIWSVGVMAASLLCVFLVQPLWGIDFTGGSLIEVTPGSALGDTNNPQPISDVLHEQFQLSSSIQSTQDGTLLIRTSHMAEDTHQAILGALRSAEYVAEELRFETIGPVIGQELKRRALMAVGLAIGAMLLYLAFTFRHATDLTASWKFGVAAAYALLHDIVVVTAMFVLFGAFWQVPLDSLFVSAMLAIAGYSVNDTIVIFSRLKEDWLARRGRADLAVMLDRAARVTLTRSLNTALATLMTLVALFLFGGLSIRWFVVALTAGIVIGTYSSIFVAAPFLYILTRGFGYGGRR